MLACKIEGLVVASERNAVVPGERFITFVRGKYNNGFEVNNPPEENEQDDTDTYTPSYSKEVRVAKLYRTLVYHLFI